MVMVMGDGRWGMRMGNGAYVHMEDGGDGVGVGAYVHMEDGG